MADMIARAGDHTRIDVMPQLLRSMRSRHAGATPARRRPVTEQASLL